MVDLTHKRPIDYLLRELGGVKVKSKMEERVERRHPQFFEDTQPIPVIRDRKRAKR